MPDLAVIVPTRGRPESLPRIVDAWSTTGGFDSADLILVADDDDPSVGAYEDAWHQAQFAGDMIRAARWEPLVPKLNRAVGFFAHEYFALAFAGDDHLPRTPGWAKTMVDALREMGTGVVYGDDLLQRERLCTSWAMTSDIVRALGRMVPAPVEHMYCDNAVMDLARLAGCLRYLPDVVIEHMHPVVGKAPMDAGYERVNRPEQYRSDELAYGGWLRRGRAADVATVKALMT
jgi:hypothetical protein